MGGLFSRPKTPEPPPVQRMPDIEDPQNQQAAAERRRRTMANQGRASTLIASDSSAGAYSNTKLGQ
jgi:hypothetical protein